MRRNSVLVNDILFSVLDLLNSNWESVQSSRILDSDLVSHQPCQAGCYKRAVCLWPSSLPGISLSSELSPLMCLSLKLTPALCAGLGPAMLLTVFCCVWSLITFLLPNPGSLFSPLSALSWVTPEFLAWTVNTAPQLVVAHWAKLRVALSFDIDIARPALNRHFRVFLL